MDCSFSNDLEIIDLKCGEVFLSENSFILFCTLCETKFKEFQVYANHIIKKHFLFDVVDDKTAEQQSAKLYEDSILYSQDRLEEDFKGLEDYQVIEEIEVSETAENTEDEELVVLTITDIADKEKVHPDPVVNDQLTAESVKEQIYNCNKKSSKSNKKRFRCWECDREFFTRIGYRKHSRRHTGERNYHCDRGECGESFITFDAFKNHMEQCTFEQVIFEEQCPDCGMHFNNKDTFQKHTKAHYQPFKCKKCYVSLKTARGLKRHMLSHEEGNQEIICQLCSISFNNQTSLMKHLTTKHSGASQVKVFIRQT